MPTTLSAIEKPLSKVLCSDYEFEIPAYQRPYAWTTNEVGELLDDISLALAEGDGGQIEELSPYFLGSIVVIKDPEQRKSEVVDGQQRLTTLTILFSVLRELSENGLANDLDNYVRQAPRNLEGIPEKFRLTLRTRDQEFFKKYVQTHNGLENLGNLSFNLTDSQTNIRNNAKYIESFFQNMKADALANFARFIITRCFLVVVATSDQESAYRIFSVMNDRGMDLSPTDILKAEIIGAIEPEREVEYTNKWENVEESLGREAFTELFAHVRMIVQKNKQKKTLINELKSSIPFQEKPKEFIDETLVPLADAMEIALNESYTSQENPNEINKLFRCLNRIDNIDWLPPALLYFSKEKGNHDRLKGFLVALERLAYAMFIMRSNINYRINRYAELLREIEDGADLTVDESAMQLTPDEMENTLSGLDGPIYLSTRVVRPILLRLDELLAEGGATYDHKVISVEHVLPQSPATDSDWIQSFPTEEMRLATVHRLGNLVLLSRRKNSMARNYDFEKKKSQYFTVDNVSNFSITTQVLATNEWTPETVEQRQKDLVDKLANLWRLR